MTRGESHGAATFLFRWACAEELEHNISNKARILKCLNRDKNGRQIWADVLLNRARLRNYTRVLGTRERTGARSFGTFLKSVCVRTSGRPLFFLVISRSEAGALSLRWKFGETCWERVEVFRSGAGQWMRFNLKFLRVVNYARRATAGHSLVAPRTISSVVSRFNRGATRYVFQVSHSDALVCCFDCCFHCF